MGVILIQGNRVGNFLRLGINLYVDANLTQQRKQFSIKSGDGFWRKRQRTIRVRGSQLQAVVDEVELDFKRASAVRDRRGGQASRVYIQCNIPEMVHQRRQAQT